jgi:hypothetical protein
MKAIIVTAEKQTIPQFNETTQQDEPTLVVALSSLGKKTMERPTSRRPTLSARRKLTQMIPKRILPILLHCKNRLFTISCIRHVVCNVLG